jgi:hypothetical protein
VGDAEKDTLCHIAVALEVVTKHEGKRLQAAFTAAIERCGDATEGGDGLLRMLKVVLNLRVIRVKSRVASSMK